MFVVLVELGEPEIRYFNRRVVGGVRKQDILRLQGKMQSSHT